MKHGRIFLKDTVYRGQSSIPADRVVDRGILGLPVDDRLGF
jgi:hypothetical protein